MKFGTRDFRGLQTTLVTLLALMFTTGCETSVSTGKMTAEPAHSRLRDDMVGTWVHVGVPGRVREAPTAGGRFKMRDGDHWNLTVVDGDTGLVTENFGGTYTLNGDQYVETQQYGTPQWLQ